MLNVKIRTTSGKLCSFELCSIICHNSSRHTESVYDVLQELDCCLLGYIYYWHNFHPFSESVNFDEQILKPPRAIGKMPTISIPQTAKGQEISIGRRGLACFVICF
jgi:hypothetical protein